MPETKLSFAVGSPETPRSTAWSLVGQNHDVYIIPLEVKSTAKISLHLRTGEFSWGYSSDDFRKNRAEIIERAQEYGVAINPSSRDFEKVGKTVGVRRKFDVAHPRLRIKRGTADRPGITD